MNEKIALASKLIAEIEAELDKSKEAHASSQAERSAIRGKLDDIAAKIAESKNKTEEINANQRAIIASRSDAYAELNKEKEKLRDIRQRKYLEEKEKRRIEQERERARRNEVAEKKRERDAEREKVELLLIPYEQEIDLCTHLTQYLESLLPPKPKEDIPASKALPEGADDVTFLKKDEDEGELGGKKKFKKQKPVKVTQDLKHNVEVFLHFETLSITPPSKLVDVEASINELKAKKEHFSKLSAAQQELNKQKTAAKQKEPTQQEDAAKSVNAETKEASPEEGSPAAPASEEAVVAE